MTFALHVLRFLPRNVLSRAFGWLAARRRPRPLVRAATRWWIRHYKVDLDIAVQPEDGYESVVAMFTRRLTATARPIADAPFICPVDATVGAHGRVTGGRMIQAKGLDYSLEALLGSTDLAQRFANAWYATLYLSPRDYHRIHSPAAGRIVESIYEPGTLWPVNPPAVRTVPNLFAVNERVTTRLEIPAGEIAVVMVGATNVGSIRLSYTNLVTNASGTRRRAVREHEPPVDVARGEELGVFALGSTVIVLVAHDEFQPPQNLAEGEWRAMGSALGVY